MVNIHIPLKYKNYTEEDMETNQRQERERGLGMTLNPLK